MNRIIFAIQKEINCRKNVAGLTGELVGLTLAKNIVEDLIIAILSLGIGAYCTF